MLDVEEDGDELQNERKPVTIRSGSPQTAESQKVFTKNEIDEHNTEIVKIENEGTVKNEEHNTAKRPDYYGDHARGFEEDITIIDYCYRLLCNIQHMQKQ